MVCIGLWAGFGRGQQTDAASASFAGPVGHAALFPHSVREAGREQRAQ